MLHILPAFGVIRVLDFCCSTRYVVVSHCCFNFYFSDNIRCGASFYMLTYHIYIFFGEVPIKVLAHFLIRLFFSCWVLRIICIFWITILYQVCLLKTFSSSQGLVFSFSWHCLLQSRGFNFNKVQLFSSFLHGSCL